MHVKIACADVNRLCLVCRWYGGWGEKNWPFCATKMALSFPISKHRTNTPERIVEKEWVLAQHSWNVVSTSPYQNGIVVLQIRHESKPLSPTPTWSHTNLSARKWHPIIPVPLYCRMHRQNCQSTSCLQTSASEAATCRLFGAHLNAAHLFILFICYGWLGNGLIFPFAKDLDWAQGLRKTFWRGAKCLCARAQPQFRAQ